MLIKLFNGVIESPETYKIQMELNADNTAELRFKRQMSFKEVTMLQVDFNTADQHIPSHKLDVYETAEEAQPDVDLIKQHIRHRHNIATQEMEVS